MYCKIGIIMNLPNLLPVLLEAIICANNWQQWQHYSYNFFYFLYIYEKYFGFGKVTECYMRSYFASVISDQSVKSKQNLLFLIEMLNFSYSKLAIEAPFFCSVQNVY